MKSEFQADQCVIEITEGDITQLTVDAIVNPANTALILGGGVAGAIRNKGGPVIQEECNRIGGTNVGGAVITGAGNLAAKYVIHAVGPRMGEGDEDLKLKRATINTLQLALDNHLDSVAFPAISTGIFGYPVDRCSMIMLQETMDFLSKNQAPARVIFCLFGVKNYEVFKNTMEKLFG
jgi:O-acetyl-ADP-ribose deacetylase (regulator of RNase III)